MAPAEIASKINWDKAITSDEREVCHTQAALFEFCQKNSIAMHLTSLPTLCKAK